MRLVVILTLGFGVCGTSITEAEKIVFVVPRYVRRSYSGNASPFYSHGEGGYKMGHSMRPGTKRPRFNGHYGDSSSSNAEQYFPGEKYREDFDQGRFPIPDHAVNHVVIPHGKGISHGISFGKGYIPREPETTKENFEFPTGNGNNVEFNEQIDQHRHESEKEEFPGFQEQSQASANQAWPFGRTESTHDQEQVRIVVPDNYKGQGEPTTPKEEHFFQRTPSPEEHRVNLSPGIPPAGPPTMTAQGATLTPIILQDTIDMKEYVEKIQSFAKSWPPAVAAGLHNFQWTNPAGIRTTPNFYQGYNSWTSSLSTVPRGYQVQEESQEGPNRRSFEVTIM